MQFSHDGLELLKSLEGFRDTAYKDGGGVWTIGYGTTRIDGVPVKAGDKTTVAVAEQCLLKDSKNAQDCINKYVGAPLTQNQYDALVCFVYNIGNGAFKTSTMLKMLNMALYSQAATQFRRWIKINGVDSKGLANRRAREENLFLK